MTIYDDESGESSNKRINTSNELFTVENFVLKVSTDNGETWNDADEDDGKEGTMV